MKVFNGKYHLIYTFDWLYQRYKYSKIKVPWKSGLTDGHALLFLLIRYDYFGDEKYKKAVDALYLSVISSIEKRESLNILNDSYLWIEEYVGPKTNPKYLPYVFNGMIYAYKRVGTYELYLNTSQNIINIDKIF